MEPAEDTRTPLYLHFEYHPENVPRPLIRKLYYKHLGEFEEELGLAPPKIAYSRPNNLGEIAAPAKLYEAPGRDAGTHLKEYTESRGLVPPPTGLRRGLIPRVNPSVRLTAPPAHDRGGSPASTNT